MFRLNKKKLIVLSLCIISIICLAGLIVPSRVILLSVIKFPLKLFHLIGEEFSAVVFYHRNYVENLRLHRENDLLKNKLLLLNELYLENTRLKEILSFKQKSPLKLVACRVIGRSPSNWLSIIIIDKGKNSYLKKNQLVITPLGVAGKIIETGPLISKVMLINDPGFNIPVIAERSRQEGLVSGTLRKNLIMRYLAYDADIEIGDLVITSGLDGIYPKGILIGKVIGLSRDATGLSRYAVVEPAVDISRLEEVLVVVR